MRVLRFINLSYYSILHIAHPHQMRQIINTIFCVSCISRFWFCSASLRSIGTGWILMRISFDVKLSLTEKTSLFSMNFINLQSNKSQNCTDFLTISLSEQYLLGWSAHRKWLERALQVPFWNLCFGSHF